jgi:hypothetical protein
MEQAFAYKEERGGEGEGLIKGMREGDEKGGVGGEVEGGGVGGEVEGLLQSFLPAHGLIGPLVRSQRGRSREEEGGGGRQGVDRDTIE